MPKTRTHYVCQQCGHEAIRWLGRCPDCGVWNSLTEELVVDRPARAAGAAVAPAGLAPRPVTEISLDDHQRAPCGMLEFDRVLGGGCVPGSVVLIGGDPGIGKSTLLMQVAARLGEARGTTLYVTGEESPQQVRMRAERLGTLSERLLLTAETDLDVIEAHLQRLRPDFVVLDSIQTAHDPSLSSAPATVSQLRSCCARMTRLAKSSGTAVFLVGHVTKEGAIAGPRVLEHMVDTVLYFEGDRFQTHRILRSVKNRFGSTDEIGIFVMRETGLAEVANASEWMLAQRPGERPGSAVVSVIEGTRPLLVEVQALVSRSYSPTPRRMATGLDYNRVCMILAVLEKRCGLRLADKDVYVNVPGGIRVIEPAADLGIAVALVSSYRDAPVDASLVVAGEVGLSGEVRAVQQTEKRLREAERLGFARALAAGYLPRPGSIGMETIPVTELREALQIALRPPIRHGTDEAPAFAGQDEAA
jgi:DNA repair protein RadA/Sms